MATNTQQVWYKALDPDELPEGRVMPKAIGVHTVCMTHFEGEYAALLNRCPHQGGPLGEGSIENGMLRCPWHGWDYHPTTGMPPDGYGDCVPRFPVEIRDDGIYVGVEEDAPHETTVTDIMAETLTNWGVRNVFGMVGHSNLGLADALRRESIAGRLRYVGVRHEGAAAFACSAYGKLTGRPAACVSIAGPGATNLLTGLWDANVDRSPVIALTGQVDTQVLGAGAFQEVDLSAAFGKVAQWTQTVLHTSKHAELANLACKSAILNRGVSHLIFPDEVQTLPAAQEASAGGPEGRLASRAIAPPAGAMDAAVALLSKAERPVLIVGHGARFDMPAILELAESLRCPVVTTFKGKGLLSDRHELGCGVLGRSGTPIASWFMNESDALLVLGASFSNHTGITPKKPTIQVDFDAMALGKFHKVDVPVWGEIAATVAILRERLANTTSATDQRREIADRWRIWRAEKERRRADDRGHGVNSASIFAALTEHAPDDAILPVDVGNNTYSFGRYFECDQQAVLMSGYLGSIGFSLPAAMGAWVATQEDDPRFHGRKVVSISGDGGFGQYMGELLTAVKYGMNIHNPRFADYAELCGAKGVLVEKQDQLGAALSEAIAHPGPSLVEIVADPELI